MKVYCYDCGKVHQITYDCGNRRCYRCRKYFLEDQLPKHLESGECLNKPKSNLTKCFSCLSYLFYLK